MNPAWSGRLVGNAVLSRSWYAHRRGDKAPLPGVPAILRGGYLRELPVTEGLPAAPEDEPAVPVGGSVLHGVLPASR